MTEFSNLRAADLVGMEIDRGEKAVVELEKELEKISIIFSRVANDRNISKSELKELTEGVKRCQISLDHLANAVDFTNHTYEILVERRKVSQDPLHFAPGVKE